MRNKQIEVKAASFAARLARVARLRRRLARAEHDFLLVCGMANIRYLTGFPGSSGYLLVAPDSLVLYTDGRYDIQARRQTRDVEVRISTGSLLAALAGDFKKRRIRRLGFEQNRISFDTYHYLRGELRGRRFQPLNGLVEKLRMIKSDGEIDRIRASVDLNSAAFERVCHKARPGWTEARLASEIEYEMRKLGAERAAFETIAASGERSALPHAQPNISHLRRNALIVVDHGAILDGYTSDMTRMICFGRVDQRQRELFEAVREAQLAAVGAVKAGVRAGTVDRGARQVLRKFKLEKEFSHSAGHGLGLEIHEPPRIGPKEDLRLRAGMVITIEPGAYVEGVGGARIEDVVAVTKNGCEVLTKTPRDLRVL